MIGSIDHQQSHPVLQTDQLYAYALDARTIVSLVVICNQCFKTRAILYDLCKLMFGDKKICLLVCLRLLNVKCF